MAVLKKDFNNSFWLALQYACLIILSFISLKLNLLTFGADAFGEWLLLLSMWGVGTALDLGFGLSTVKFVAMYKKDHKHINAILSTSFLLFIVLGIVISLFGFGIAELFYFSNQSLFRPEHLSEIRLVCFFLCIHFYCNYLVIFFRSILEGFSEYAITAKFSIFQNILLFVCILLIYIYNASLYMLALSYIFTVFVHLILLVSITMFRYPQIHISPVNVSMGIFRKLLGFSLSIQATYLLAALIDPIVKYIIGNFSDKKLIPSYEIARRFAMAFSGLFSFSLRNTFPRISVLRDSLGYRNFMHNTGIAVSRFSISYSGFFYGVLAFGFSILFIYFYKSDYCLEIYLLLILAESVNNFNFILYTFIIGIGKTFFLVFLQGLNLLILSLLLIAGFHFFNGPVGLAGLYFSVVIGGFAMMFYLKHIHAVDAKRFYKNSRVWRLAVFHLLILATYFFIVIKNEYWAIIEATLSAICFLLFFRDFWKFRKSLAHYRINPFTS